MRKNIKLKATVNQAILHKVEKSKDEKENVRVVESVYPLDVVGILSKNPGYALVAIHSREAEYTMPIDVYLKYANKLNESEAN